MREKNLQEHFCPLEHVTTVIGGKWKLRILWQLTQMEVIRFNELKRQINGITDLMLTKSLKELAQDGIVERIQYNEVPPRVEYKLTLAGEQLLAAFQPVTEWAMNQKQDFNHHGQTMNQKQLLEN
ncbi:MAG: winged helix-turn-helix transcriptional regulator [Culicoidibacterales bacterium]